MSDHHTRESVRVTTLGFSRLPAERLDSFLLSLNRYPISDLNKIYQYSRIFYPTICIRLLWILFNLESNNDYDSLGIINENLSTGKFTNNNAR